MKMQPLGKIFFFTSKLGFSHFEPMAYGKNPVPQTQTQILGLNYHIDSVCLPSLVIRYFIHSRKCVGENK